MGHQTGSLAEFDLCLVELPKKFQPRRDRVDCFAVRADFKNLRNNLEIMLPTPDEYMNIHWGIAKANDKPVRVDSSETGTYYVRQTYQYNLSTKPGDCGAPMILLNNRLATRKIFGIHVAAHPDLGLGFAASVCQEDILADLALMPEQIVVEPVVVDIEPQVGDVFRDNRFRYLGQMKQTPSRSSNVDIVKSRLHSTYSKALTAPARLRPFSDSAGIIIDPLAKAQRKFCTEDVYIEQEPLELIVESYFSWYDQVCIRDVARRTFTLKEALIGLESEDCFSSLASDTSAGYPMNLSGTRNFKKELFSTERFSVEWDASVAELQLEIDSVLAKYKAGIRPVWLYTDNLKVERLPKEKVAIGKTRMFCGCPFVLLLITRMYYGAFTQHFMMNRIRNGSAIGVNPYGLEWDILARHLSTFDSGTPQVGAGDYSGFDASEKPQIHQLIGVGINNWYNGTPEETLIREILFLEVYQSRHIIDGEVYEWDSSLPSGSALTTPVNTIYNHIAFRWCFYDITKEITTFNDNVYVIALGDDNVFTVSPKYREVFNEMTICESMSKIGLKYTMENKQDIAVTNFRDLTSVEFLKRQFRREKDLLRYVAPLRLSVVLEIPQWTKKGQGKLEIVSSNTITALRELSLHGREVYDKFSKDIVASFQDHYPGVTTSEPLQMPYRLRRAEALNCADCF
jgi:hypothetical protein